MRLGIPPTLKQSSLLIDSHCLTVANSPLIPSPRGLTKRSSRTFKEDGSNSQFGQEQGLGMNFQMTITQSRQGKKSRLLTPQSGYGILKRRTGTESQQQIRSSHGSILKKMPLFNQFQQQENLSQLRVSHNLQQFTQQQQLLQNQHLSRLPQTKTFQKSSKSINNPTQIENTPILQQQSMSTKRTSLRQMNHPIQVINQQQSSSQGNSLNGSRKLLQQKVGLKKSIKNGYSSNNCIDVDGSIHKNNNENINLKDNLSNDNKNDNKNSVSYSGRMSRLKSSKSLQPIMQYDDYFHSELSPQQQQNNNKNKRYHAKKSFQQSPSSSSLNNINIHINYAQQQKNNIQINNKQQVNLNLQEQKHYEQKNRMNRIRQKLIDIQKSIKMNQDHSMWEGTQMGESSSGQMRSEMQSSIQNSRQKSKETVQLNKNNNELKNEQKQLFDMMNERFRRIKQLKTSSNRTPKQSNKLKQYPITTKLMTKQKQQTIIIPNNEKIDNYNQNINSHSDKCIQTSTLEQENKVFQQQKQKNKNKNYQNTMMMMVHKQYNQQIVLLFDQIQKYQTQIIKLKQQNITFKQQKTQIQNENRFLTQKIKKLQRILQQNQTQLLQLKLKYSSIRQNSKQAQLKTERQKQQSNNQYDNNIKQYMARQKMYINKIAQLQSQLFKLSYQQQQQQKDNNKIQNMPTFYTNNNNIKEGQQQFSIKKSKHTSSNLPFIQYLKKIQNYQMYLKKNMQMVKIEQQKIVQQWFFIKRLYGNKYHNGMAM